MRQNLLDPRRYQVRLTPILRNDNTLWYPYMIAWLCLWSNKKYVLCCDDPNVGQSLYEVSFTKKTKLAKEYVNKRDKMTSQIFEINVM